MNARPAGFLRFATLFAALALLSCGDDARMASETKTVALCPDRLEYLFEYRQLEKQEGNVAFSWALKAYEERLDRKNRTYLWPLEHFPWQTSEEALQRSLWPHVFFGPGVEDVLKTARREEMGLNAMVDGGLTFLLAWQCFDYTLLCIDGNHRVWNVEMGYGRLTDSIYKPYPVCHEEGCAQGGMRRELAKSDVIGQLELMSDGIFRCGLGPCIASPETKVRYGRPYYPARSLRRMQREKEKRMELEKLLEEPPQPEEAE